VKRVAFKYLPLTSRPSHFLSYRGHSNEQICKFLERRYFFRLICLIGLDYTLINQMSNREVSKVFRIVFRGFPADIPMNCPMNHLRFTAV
jgi:hypothetical protein